MTSDYIAPPTWPALEARPLILESLRLPEISDNREKFPFDVVVPCLLCDAEYSHPAQHKELLQHLLKQHKFVIADVHMTGDFPAYLKYWKHKFQKHKVAAYCTSMRARMSFTNGDAAGDAEGELQEFSLLSDIVPEDKELRRKLQGDRLEQVIQQQEAERRETTFHRGCLFCRQNFHTSRDLFDHMAFDHNFSVGQPDNLVFVSKFLDLIEEKLENLICLYCEKVFKSREVLKEHMRKKQHKQLNPKNSMWDQFYIANYLEFGKKWEERARERDYDEPVDYWDLEREGGEGNDNDWSDWRGDHGGMVCLFCNATYSEICDLTNHMVEVHGFDFNKLKSDLSLNFYQQVKVINYIRRCVHLNTCLGCSEVFASRAELMSHMAWCSHQTPSPKDWDQPQYYFPTYENDNLLHSLQDLEGEGLDDVAPQVKVLPEDIKVCGSILQEEELRKSLLPPRRSK